MLIFWQWFAGQIDGDGHFGIQNTPEEVSIALTATANNWRNVKENVIAL
jgi:hypothetical protein